MTSCATSLLLFLFSLISRAIVAAAGWDICNRRTTKKSVLEWVMENSAGAQLQRNTSERYW